MAVETQIQVRRGTAATWTSTNPTLAAGEVGFETDTGKFKIGNGSSTWTGLTYTANGGIPESIIDAKGDIVIGTAADTPAVLPAGANGLYLAADSAVASGLKWTTVVSSVTGAFGAVVPSGSTGGTYTVTNNFSSGVYTIGISRNIPTFNLGDITETLSGTYYTSTTSTSATFVAQGPWTTRDANFGISDIEALTFGNGVYVAGGRSGGVSGNLSTSTDGITWTTRNSNLGSSTVNALTFGNGIYVAGGFNNKLSTSTDGITWTSRNPFFGTSNINALTFGNGLYLAGGTTGRFSISTDAITWTTRSPGFSENVTALTFGNNLYVVGGGVVGGTPRLRTSTDAITWTARTVNFGTSVINALTFGDGVYVAGGTGGNLSTSTDGITWTTRDAKFGSSNINALTFGNGVYVAGGDGGRLRTSTDAITWTTRVSNFGTSVINALTFGDGVYVAGGNEGNLTTTINVAGILDSNAFIQWNPSTTLTATL
jgi:hypothetical protein